MKKTPRKNQRVNMNLGDLILAVSSVSHNKRETVAAVTDLIESGRVRFQSHGRTLRARVS
ncbi:MAG TPA: hypothetical protein VNQ90_06335 [Chthoniobacteraceae bacterium]|nr:hypothetical protein [Chthoniobacteraceae bacterium]